MYEKALWQLLSGKNPELEEKLKDTAPNAAALMRADPETLSAIGVKSRDAILPRLFSDVMSRCAMEEMKKTSFLKAGSAKEYLACFFAPCGNRVVCGWRWIRKDGSKIGPFLVRERNFLRGSFWMLYRRNAYVVKPPVAFLRITMIGRFPKTSFRISAMQIILFGLSRLWALN